MSGCGNTVDPICPCDRFVHPRVITNPPGLASIAYRAGDYTSFRHALLLARPGETQLTQTNGTQIKPIWRPAAKGDLAVQMMDWWAYLCDVLTFYDERMANQTYLGTADLPESVKRLVAVLGYRPRPGIGATGVLAALASGPNPFTLPAGLPIQSKPGPGQQPQVFELGAATTITPPIGPPGSSIVQGTLPVVPTPTPSAAPTVLPATIVIAGTSSAVKAGERVLILPISPSGSGQGFAVATATTITPGKDALGNPITSFALGTMTSSLKGDTTQFHLLRSSSSVQVWQYPADPSFVITSGQPVLTSGQPSPTLQIDLLTIVRGLTPGDPIVFEFLDGSNPPQFGRLVSSTEAIWYANPLGYDPAQPGNLTGINPAIPPSPLGSPVSAPPSLVIPLPHTRITIEWSNGPSPTTLKNPPNYLIRYGWKDVGNLTVPPSQQVGPTDGGTGAGNGTTAAPSSPLTLQPSGGGAFPVSAGTSVLVQDVHGNGAPGIVDSATSMHLVDPVPALVQPLQALFNLLTVTRGKTVANEVLGNGNALVASQDFVLQKSPVTYLQDPKSLSGDDYSSTVQVWVNQLKWSEVRSFYDQPPNAKIFVTYEDEQGNTHVVFGDGQNGSRLPTGVNNVVASYRNGSGAGVPAPGSLTVVLQPQPGLRSILNPVPVGGGADPDPPAKVRLLAPRSVLTLGRAISIDDFEAVALDAPGVTRAMAALQFNPQVQRPTVTVWVGDDAAAVTSARAAFAATADPNRQPQVVLAQPVPITLSLTIVYDRSHVMQTVHDAVRAALVDPDNGLFGRNVVIIGQVFYDSQIYAACLKVPGVQAVHSLQFSGSAPQTPIPVNPGNGSPSGTGSGSPQNPAINNQRHDPGPGAYFRVSDTGGQPDIGMELAP